MFSIGWVRNNHGHRGHYDQCLWHKELRRYGTMDSVETTVDSMGKPFVRIGADDVSYDCGPPTSLFPLSRAAACGPRALYWRN